MEETNKALDDELMGEAKGGTILRYIVPGTVGKLISEIEKMDDEQTSVDSQKAEKQGKTETAAD